MWSQCSAFWFKFVGVDTSGVFLCSSIKLLLSCLCKSIKRSVCFWGLASTCMTCWWTVNITPIPKGCYISNCDTLPPYVHYSSFVKDMRGWSPGDWPTSLNGQECLLPISLLVVKILVLVLLSLLYLIAYSKFWTVYETRGLSIFLLLYLIGLITVQLYQVVAINVNHFVSPWIYMVILIGTKCVFSVVSFSDNG